MAVNYQPFVYRWTNSHTGQWYIGSRTARGCHPNDGYTTSSRRLKELLAANPRAWTREIIYIGTDKAEVVVYEACLLKQLDAKHDPQSLNQHNGDGKFYFKQHTEEYKQRMRGIPRKKPVRQPMRTETKEKIRAKMIGREIKWAHKISAKLIGVPKKAVNI